MGNGVIIELQNISKKYDDEVIQEIERNAAKDDKKKKEDEKKRKEKRENHEKLHF